MKPDESRSNDQKPGSTVAKTAADRQGLEDEIQATKREAQRVIEEAAKIAAQAPTKVEAKKTFIQRVQAWLDGA